MSPKRPPAHPGEVLRSRYLDPLGISVTEAAEALGVSRKHVSAIVHARAPVSPNMALRLATALGTRPEIWIELQAAFDLWHAKELVRKAPRPKVKALLNA